MTIETSIRGFQKLLAANTASASITNPTPSITEPAGDGILNMSDGNLAVFSFYGTRSAADNETFTARITGWRRLGNKTTVNLWVPVPLLALTLTQGTSTGVAGYTPSEIEYFADTIVASTAFVTSSYEIISPADNTIGLVKVDAAGCQYLQVQLAKGTNAACNALASTL